MKRPWTLPDLLLLSVLLICFHFSFSWLMNQQMEDRRLTDHQEWGRFFYTVKSGETLESIAIRAARAQFIWSDPEFTLARWALGYANPGVTQVKAGDQITIPMTVSRPPSLAKRLYDFGLREVVDVIVVDRRAGETLGTVAERLTAIGATLYREKRTWDSDWFSDFNPGWQTLTSWQIPIDMKNSEVKSIAMLQALWDQKYDENHGGYAKIMGTANTK